MMRSLRALVTRERGVSLIELMVGAAVAMIALAIVIMWVIAATRVDLDQENDFAGLNELRAAKAQMTKELRFATGELTASNPDAIEVWVDLDDSGGGGPDAAEEHVIWRIYDGDLIRYVDDDLDTAVVWVENLDTSASSLTLTDGVVDIVLSVNVEQGATASLSSRTIQTRVALRNG